MPFLTLPSLLPYYPTLFTRYFRKRLKSRTLFQLVIHFLTVVLCDVYLLHELNRAVVRFLFRVQISSVFHHKLTREWKKKKESIAESTMTLTKRECQIMRIICILWKVLRWIGNWIDVSMLCPDQSDANFQVNSPEINRLLASQYI